MVDGKVHKRGLQGPEHMRRTRSWIISSTVVTEKFLKAEPDIVTARQAAQRDATIKAEAGWPGFLGYTVIGKCR